MAKKGVTLALSSGGARGFAHIGVIKVLEQHHIPILGIAGSSMGGLIGALYCTGYAGHMIEDLAQGVRRSHWIDFSLSKMGLVRGQKLLGMMNLLTRGLHFEDCRPPLKVVAVDIEKGEEVVIDSGSVAEGVRATTSIPGMFSPYVKDGRILVDGGVLRRVPVSLAESLADGVVVAVDVGVDLSPTVRSVFDILFQTFDIMARELRRYQPTKADVVIEPALQAVRDAEFTHVEDYIQAGEAACQAHLPEILALLEE
ncbi:putative esterase of the alpha-beta hydrolase superfamily [Sulfobacillus acidophilus TPY]|uniref:Patatin n=1 Tax=Sulfobacillus acidophilus (strain ATCC 700253 / DSM 10332 / NAL) TaxID=679936 RepID=G8TVJ2_SULAD|nr:putative esterase of the alpha-beta hydrolase superfamily [Sulfobacillus acidophilus TPY]AEW05911.1 Patatin [Sulfobacillus acidophilus DSM 10332]